MKKIILLVLVSIVIFGCVSKKNLTTTPKEPLHLYEPNLMGLDCGLSFAKEIRSQIPENIKIVLIPCAVGGSSINQWVGDSLHRNVVIMKAV